MLRLGKIEREKMKRSMPSEKIRRKFAREIEEICGESLSLCYQCGKCSAGCPVAYAMDYLPNQITRFAQLGMISKVMESSTIWICASCQTCSVRCPRGIDLAKIMDALRILAKREGNVPKEQITPVFDAVFLGTVEKHGRLHELSLITKLNIASGRPFKDFSMLPAMIKRGKIRFRPEGNNRGKEVRNLMRKVEKLEARR